MSDMPSKTYQLSLLVLLLLSACLIVGSWLNLQQQLDILQNKITALIESQNTLIKRLEQLNSG